MRIILPLLLLVAIPLRGGEVVVSAAASTRDAVAEIARIYEQRTHEKVLLNSGGSNELARQIAAGAKVDVFIAADEATMARVTKRGAPLLTNRLAIVAAKPLALRDLPSLQRIAIANWSARVPAGVYWMEYLRARKLWPRVEPKLVPTVDVRAALAAFDAHAVDAALVYATDAGKRAHTLIDDGPPVVYPAAALRASGRRFYEFLFSGQARRIFAKWGFGSSS